MRAEEWPAAAGKGPDDVMAAGLAPVVLAGEDAKQFIAEVKANGNGHGEGAAPGSTGCPGFSSAPTDEADAADAAEVKTICVSGRAMHQISNDCCEVLKSLNATTPYLFRQGTAPVRLVRNSPAVVETLSQAALRGILDRAAQFVIEDAKGNQKPARLPVDVVQDLLALPALPLPGLAGIRTYPVFLPGGRLLAKDGYDGDSGWFLELDALADLRWDLDPAEALHLLTDDLLFDFPFARQSDRAHALSMLIEPFVRPMIAGPTPVYLADAPTRGTGKGLLVENPALIAQGAPAQVMVVVASNDELEKRLTATLLAGASIIFLDNATWLGPACLAAAITATAWKGRVLGLSRMVVLPVCVTWLATGNNVTLTDEMARRVVPIRLDSGVERPEDRTGFRHPDLRRWVRSQRTELVSACLSLIRAWVETGMPEGGRTLGSFEHWSRVMGGILDNAGVTGFLDDRDELYQNSDRETEEWRSLCTVWWDAHNGLVVSASDVLALARENSLLLDLWAGRSALAGQQRMGHALGGRRDRRFGEWFLRSAGRDADTKSAAWRLQRVDLKTPETPETPQPVPENAPRAPGFCDRRDQNPGGFDQNPGASQAQNRGFPGFPGFCNAPVAPAAFEADDYEPEDQLGEPPPGVLFDTEDEAPSPWR